MYKLELNLLTSFVFYYMITKSKPKVSLDEQRNLSLVESYNEANIFLGLMEYELSSLLSASHLVDYISVHIRFDLERYLLNMLNKTHQYMSDPKKFKNFKPK